MSSAAERSAIVTGARGLVGHYLLPLLLARGFAVRAVSRQPPVEPPGGKEEPSGWAGLRAGMRWVALDLARPRSEASRHADPLGPARCFIHAAPIWLLPGWLEVATEAGVRRLVAVSSTSRFTKKGSGSLRERDTAEKIAAAEDAVEASCRQHGIRWTILRPTLVYGGGRDRNVSDIARFVRRFGFFPIAGRGRGRRQPVHGADLAAAALAVLDNPATFDRAYDTPGGETIAYADMVARIALGLGRTPRLAHLPLPLLRGTLAAARWLPGLGHLTPDMADRMDEDLVFDVTAAREDFGYDPRPFRFPDEPEAGLP